MALQTQLGEPGTLRGGTPPSFHSFPGENWIFPPGGSTNLEPLQGLFCE